ncbi:MAG: M48 family metallopeptidase [Polyangiaceae bacterium]
MALFFGFYVLALALAGGLVWLPYAELVYAHRIHPKLAFICLAGAFVILRGSLFVPGAKFEPPGPEIDARDEPKLFEVIERVANRLNTNMPAHVYLMSDVNAFVAEVGGFLGFGSKRVMGIGVALLNVDDVSQLEATLAHEFGHFLGGDTRLGGFIYRTRAAISGVLSGLGDGWLSKPFSLYARLFLRVTHKVSRAQELSADSASVFIAGTDAHIASLRDETRGGVLYSSFLREEVAPLVDQGHRPENLFEGFREYVVELKAQNKLEKLDAALAEAETDPYDTHPALPERIAYAEGLPRSDVNRDTQPARSLLRDPDQLERKLTERVAEGWDVPKRLTAVSWRDAPHKVYVPKLTRESQEAAATIHEVFGGEASVEVATRTLIAQIRQFDAIMLAKRLEPEFQQASEADLFGNRSALHCSQLGLGRRSISCQRRLVLDDRRRSSSRRDAWRRNPLRIRSRLLHRQARERRQCAAGTFGCVARRTLESAPSQCY